MDFDAFRSRLKLRHAASVFASAFLAITAVIFVCRRVPNMQAIPAVVDLDLKTNLGDHTQCNCKCLENGELKCSNKTKYEFISWPVAAAASKSNLTGCALVLEVPPTAQGPTPQAHNCSCSGEGTYLCRATFAYDPWYVQATAGMIAIQLFVLCSALVWNMYYAFALNLRVLPSIPLEDVDQAWAQQWLESFWDPLHSISLWVIWCQSVTMVGNPFRIQGPFPDIRDFTTSPHVPRLRGWLPTTFEEYALLCSLGLFAATGWTLLCLVMAPALAQQEAREEERLQGNGHGTVEASGRGQMCFVTSIIAMAASTGLLIGRPVSFIYALAISVPWWLILAKQGSKSSWPPNRPFPALKSACWQLPLADAERHSLALKQMETVETKMGLVSEDDAEKQRASLGTTALIRDFCTVVKELRAAHPWRTAFELELRLQSVVLRGIQKAIETKAPAVLQQLMQAAITLGYCAPREEEEEADEANPPKQKGCCGRWVGYQKLIATVSPQDPPVRDEDWSNTLFQTLRAGLSAAVNMARVIDDDASLRWLGAIFGTLHPKIVQNLAWSVACAADALQIHVSDEERKNHELFELIAKAAGMHGDVEGVPGTTAFAWALECPAAQSRGAISVMLEEAPSRSPRKDSGQSSVELIVLEGSLNSAIVNGYRAFATKPVIVGAPDLSLLVDGRWFFEVKVYGHAVQQVAPELGGALECRIGFHQPVQRESASRNAKLDGLSHLMSCSLRSLAGRACGRGVVGCALDVKNNVSCEAWFALDGAWGYSSSGHWEPSRGLTWSVSAGQGSLYPAVSGRFVCEFAFERSQFLYGPPDDSFQPAAAALVGRQVHDSGSAPSPPRADIFGVIDDDD